MIKLSLILPVYNVEKFLRDGLSSVVDQNIDKSEYEIICIDDGSSDESGKILDEYAAKCDNFVVIHQKNAGVCVSRNKGISLARGEYIWMIDRTISFARIV